MLVSKDGTICLWDYVDGMCLKSADKLLNDYQPISATPVGDGKHIAVSGRSNHVVIVDVSKMKTLSTFANHSNWCISVFPCRIQLSETEHVFLSLCNGVVRFWTLSDDFTLTAVQTIVPDVENLKSISMCPKNTTFVAICPKSWSLFAATNSHLLETVDCPFDDEWADGIYLDSYHVMVWTMNGRACLYRIPDISKYHPMDFGSGAEYVPSSPSPNSTSSVLLRKFSIIGDIDLDDVESGNRSVISCCSNDGKLFCVASKDNDGKISLFKVPDEALGDETIEKKEEQPEIAPTIWGSIKEYWEDYSFENISSPVTASCISPELLLSITGHLDGSITIKKLPYDDSPKIYSNCHVGKVTALMVTRITKNNTYVLLTGGEDCRIYGWDLETGECVRTLTQHCGTILQLLPFPLPPVNGDKEHFLSVSSDGSIGIFSADSLGIKPTGMFGGHKSPIISVQLRTDQDYMFVNCEDDSVTIWEISTGSFEGCYPAGSLTDVKSMTMTRVPLKSRNNPNDIQKDSQSTITLYSSKVSPPIPSASVLFLNIRYLIEHKTNSKNDILQYLGLLLPWNLSEKIDSLANSIGIPFHSENFSVGTYGINGKYSLFLPNRNLSNARFSCSRQVTALQTLAVVSLITKLESLVDEESQKEVSQLKELFISNLHEFVENYQPACLGLLSNYYQDKILVIENAAHSIFLSTLKHQNEKQRAMFLQNWINRMAESDRHALKSKAIPGLLLGIVISEHSDIQLENNLYENISKSLTNLVMNYPELSVQLLAANILAKGYSVWGPFIQDTGILFEKLLSIQTPSYPGKLSQSENSVYNLVTQVPELFISTLNTLSKSKTFGSNDYLMALRVIEKLISEIPFSILDDVITVVEIVIRALNPKVSTIIYFI